MSSIRGPILRIRNASQPGPASRSASNFKHEVDVCDHGGDAHRRYLGGPGVIIIYSRSQFANTQCKAVRGRIPLCSCLQARNGRMRSCLIYLPCESRSPRGVNIAYSRSQFANAQCEAVWRCIPLGSVVQAPNMLLAVR